MAFHMHIQHCESVLARGGMEMGLVGGENDG